MDRSIALYEEFIRISKTLNDWLHITPVLYGSLGLGKTTGTDFSPQDIDILVPLLYLEEDWHALCGVMDQLGYRLGDLHEREFSNGEMQIGFSFIEDLLNFADVDYRKLEKVEDKGVAYYRLTAEEYVKVYEKSSQDGYRRTKNNQKDWRKLEFLQKGSWKHD